MFELSFIDFSCFICLELFLCPDVQELSGASYTILYIKQVMKLNKLRGQSSIVVVCASETIKTLGLYAIGRLHVLYERFQ